MKKLEGTSSKMIMLEGESQDKNSRRNFMKKSGLTLSAFAIGGIPLGYALATGTTSVVNCVPTVWNLTAGQHILVGTVTVHNDDSNLYVTYALTDPSCNFGELHMWAGNDLTLIPGGGTSRPPPGQLCSTTGGACADATGATTYTFTIPFGDLNLVGVTDICGVTLNVVTHAEVNCVASDGTVANETAYGGPIPGAGNAWWFYGQYDICCDPDNPPGPVALHETAFAYGTHVFTTGRKSNPDGLESLELTRNRWGWAINLTEPSTYVYAIYAGAGLNNTAKGTLVGTLTVVWDGALANVTYQLDGDCKMSEVHIYAGDTPPTTLAPGQYGNTKSFDPGVTSYTLEDITLSDLDGDGVWLVAHAVVSC